MIGSMGSISTVNAARALRLALIAACSLMTTACAEIGGGDGKGLDLFAKADKEADIEPASGIPLTDLQKATAHWAKAYQKSPQDIKAAMAYAKNLKAMGEKAQAFAVLQQTAQFHAGNKELASEYGRLALELDQISLAAQLLEYADDPTNPDWRVISARGAALAKQGKYKDAVLHLERAQKLAPAQMSVMNNLALAYTMNGEAAKAEDLLRQAVNTGDASAKTKQNLALVLGLQGKYDEATQMDSTAVASDTAKANTALLKQIVKLEPKKTLAPTNPVAVASAPAALPAFKTIAADPASVAAAWATTVTADTTPVPAPAR